MPSRFTGPNAHRQLLDAFRMQATLCHNEDVIERLAKGATVERFAKGKYLFKEEDDDQRIAFILSGEVGIEIGGRHVATRTANGHVGEMSLIDTSARRSASVLARKETCVAWVEEGLFTAVANEHSELWRALAVDLGARLRGRGEQVPKKNEIPHIFIGSSSETVRIAKATEKFFKDDRFKVKLWENIFSPSEYTLESLERQALLCDFGILFCLSDDNSVRRGSKINVPRDNVIFELGMLVGAFGRERAFIVSEKGTTLPTDLSGLNIIYIKKSWQNIKKGEFISNEVISQAKKLGSK